ncbi:MAG TPA: hypothetical protein VGC08_12745, partial [Pedobacter sp.]
FSLIRRLNAQKDPVAAVYLYTDDHLNRFEGTRPAVNFHLNWKFFPAEKKEVTWTAGTFSLTQDRIRKLTAHSSPEGTYYQQEDSKRAAGPDTGKIEVSIFGNDRQADVTYLGAAIHAIAEFTQRKIEVKEIRSLTQITKKANLVFWLSDHDISAAQLKELPAGVSFFSYAGHQQEKIKSVFQYQQGINTTDIAVYQRTKYDGKQVRSLWNDGFGDPLLTLDTTGHIHHYQFYSRFNQGWTDLVWDNGMVMALMPIVIPHREADFGFTEDRRSLRAVSSVPKLPYDAEKRHTGENRGPAVFDEERPLSVLFWWLALVTFFIERLLTYRKIERKV